jgi:hypothetical protein
MSSISPVTAIETPNATASPAQMLCSNAFPPRRPMKNAYSAQMTAATAVPAANRRRGYPVSPQLSVTAVRPPGMNRHTMTSWMPNRRSERSAQSRVALPFGLEKNLRSTAGPNRRPSR